MRGRDDKIWRRGSAKGQAFPLSERAIEVEMIRLFIRATARRFPIAENRDLREGARIGSTKRRGLPATGKGGICRSAAAKVRRRRLARSTAPSLGPSLGQLLADRLQFAFTFGARFGIGIFEFLEGLEDIWDTMRRAFSLSSAGMMYQGACRARRAEALLVRRHVVFPVFSLLDVRVAELPVLLGIIDALQEALSLLLLRKVKKELDDAGPVAMRCFSKSAIER